MQGPWVRATCGIRRRVSEQLSRLQVTTDFRDMTKVKVTAHAKATIVVGVLKEGIKVEVLESGIVIDVKPSEVKWGLEEVSSCEMTITMVHLRQFHRGCCRMEADPWPVVVGRAAAVPVAAGHFG